jgi:signal peptidase II
MMKKALLSTGIRWLWLAFLVLAIDLGSKFWVISTFELRESLNILPFFNLTYVHNIGAAFSIFEGHRWPLMAIAVLICTVLTVMLYRNSANEKLVNIAYAVIIGGAAGNFFDRLVHGYVIDFFHFYIMDWQVPVIGVTIENWHYPVFNVADIAICIGAGLIIVDAIRVSRREHYQQRQRAAAANDKEQ